MLVKIRWLGLEVATKLVGFISRAEKEWKLVRVGENESKGGKGVWANRIKNKSNVSVRGRRIQDNGWIARVNDDDEEEGEGEGGSSGV